MKHLFFPFSVGASFKPIHDEASNSTSSCPQTSTATEATTVVTSHPDPDHQSKTTAAPPAVSGSTAAVTAENSQQDSSNPEPSTTANENTPVKTNTSAASKAAAFFTSGKMSSSSTDLKKSKASPVEGSDCELNTFRYLLPIFCSYCVLTNSTEPTYIFKVQRCVKLV